MYSATDYELELSEDTDDDEESVGAEDDIGVEGMQPQDEGALVGALVGRPEKFIDMDLVSFMRDNFMKWTAIAAALNVSRWTLHRHCQKIDYVDNKPFADLDQIRDLVNEYHGLLPSEGTRTPFPYFPNYYLLLSYYYLNFIII